MFLRGKPQLHERMKRIPARHRKAPVNEGNKCPNFYEIARKSPLPEVPMTRFGDRAVVTQGIESAASLQGAMSRSESNFPILQDTRVLTLQQNFSLDTLIQNPSRRNMFVPASVASWNASQVSPPRNDIDGAQLVDQLLSRRMNNVTLESMRARKLLLDNILNRCNNGAHRTNFLRQPGITNLGTISQLQSQFLRQTSALNPIDTHSRAVDYRGLGANNAFRENALVNLDELLRDRTNSKIEDRSEESRWLDCLSKRSTNDTYRNKNDTIGNSTAGFRWSWRS